MDSLFRRQTYLTNGGTVAEARKQLSDLGITVENAIGFRILLDIYHLYKGDFIEQLRIAENAGRLKEGATA